MVTLAQRAKEIRAGIDSKRERQKEIGKNIFTSNKPTVTEQKGELEKPIEKQQPTQQKQETEKIKPKVIITEQKTTQIPPIGKNYQTQQFLYDIAIKKSQEQQQPKKKVTGTLTKAELTSGEKRIQTLKSIQQKAERKGETVKSIATGFGIIGVSAIEGAKETIEAIRPKNIKKTTAGLITAASQPLETVRSIGTAYKDDPAVFIGKSLGGFIPGLVVGKAASIGIQTAKKVGVVSKITAEESLITRVKSTEGKPTDISKTQFAIEVTEPGLFKKKTNKFTGESQEVSTSFKIYPEGKPYTTTTSIGEITITPTKGKPIISNIATKSISKNIGELIGTGTKFEIKPSKGKTIKGTGKAISTRLPVIEESSFGITPVIGETNVGGKLELFAGVIKKEAEIGFGTGFSKEIFRGGVVRESSAQLIKAYKQRGAELAKDIQGGFIGESKLSELSLKRFRESGGVGTVPQQTKGLQVTTDLSTTLLTQKILTKTAAETAKATVKAQIKQPQLSKPSSFVGGTIGNIGKTYVSPVEIETTIPSLISKPTQERTGSIGIQKGYTFISPKPITTYDSLEVTRFKIEQDIKPNLIFKPGRSTKPTEDIGLSKIIKPIIITKPVTKPKEDMGLSEIIKPKVINKPAIKQKQLPTTLLQTRTIPKYFFPGGSFIIPKLPINPKTFNIPLQKRSSQYKIKSITKQFKTDYKYKPSLAAVASNIRTKKKKKDLDLYTGLQIRPVIY